MEELKRRIEGRETREELLRRFKSSYEELNFITRYNYLVVNDSVEDAAKRIESIVIAEKCRVDRNRDFYLRLQGGMYDE